MKKLAYEGKAKKVYELEDPTQVWIEYKDSLTAFNAQKKGQFQGKGEINLSISEILFERIQKANVATHWIQREGPTELRAKKVQIIPFEVVIRNTIAGSLAKKLGLEEGADLSEPLVEFYLKNDELGDPFVSEEQIRVLKMADVKTVQELRRLAYSVNGVLLPLFKQVGIRLVDFKVEFGFFGHEILLADEISPDCMRLWDLKTMEKLDKDRFRRDLGQVEESYQEVLMRLKGVK